MITRAVAGPDVGGRLNGMIEHLSDAEVHVLLKGAPYASGFLPPAADLDALVDAGLMKATLDLKGEFVLTAEGWVRLLSDVDLRKAYRGTDGESENEVADLLAAEGERRNIDL